MRSTHSGDRERGETTSVDGLTRSLRRVRAAQLDEIHAAIEARQWARAGYRSATDWLTVTSREAWGQCRLTVHLAERIQAMPHVKAAFTAGDLAESALRLLADTWSETNAAAFGRDEQ
ncbi:MAG: HNH endonuclease, partial [Acidimicrobiia bacterium]|nr:HNH endonuclease [Acidimicrobiia bacterium]